MEAQCSKVGATEKREKVRVRDVSIDPLLPSLSLVCLTILTL
jgi:hypothetical protein